MRSAHAIAAPAGFRSEEGQAGGEIESLEQKRARLRALRQIQFEAETFEGFVYRMQPLYAPVPNHLRPLYELIERSRHEPMRALVSMSPRHGKTETLRYALAWRALYDPAVQNAYATYGMDLSKETGLAVRAIGRSCGVQIGKVTADMVKGVGSATVLDWKTSLGGGLKSTSLGGAITGRGVNGLLVVDDALKGSDVAASLGEKNRIWRWLRTDILSRLEGGGSCIIVQCIAEGELVPMADGTWRPIESIRPGDRVIGYDTETHRTVPKEVTAQRCSDEDDIYEIVTDHYSLKANARHPVLVVPSDGGRRFALRYQWRLVSDLRPGDVVVGLKSFDNGADMDYLKSIGVPADDDFGWLFGFLLGDGWVSVGRKTQYGKVYESYCVCCALSDEDRTYPRPPDTPHQRRWADEPLSGSEVNRRFISLMEFFFCGRPYETGFGYMRVDDTNAGRFLSDLGLRPGKRAKDKTMPDWVFRAPLSFRRAVLRGLLDADGHKPRRGRSYRLGTCSLELTRGARLLALVSGARATKIMVSSQRVKAPHSKEPIIAKTYVTDILVDAIDKEPEGTGAVKDWVGTDTRLVRVRSISPAGRSRVYDITVDGAENFFPGGLCAHNTRWAEDDPIGRMLNGGADWPAGLGEEWEYINLPAIGDEFGNPVDEREHPHLARPLWTSVNSRYPNNPAAAMEWYRVCRARDEAGWWALYQGTPRSQGMKLFGNDPEFTYMPIEFKGRRAMLMLDPAAKGKESSDNSALGCFTMKGFGDATIWGIDRWGEKIEVINPNPSVMEVVEVWKNRIPVPDVIDEAYRWQKRYGGLHLGVEIDGTGANLPDMIRRLEPKLVITEVKTGGKDKYTRAQPASKAWRSGRILVPRADDQGRILDQHGEPYRTRDGGYVVWQCPPREYIRVMKAFTGMGDPEDDLVDITSASFSRLYRPWNESRQGTVRAPAY